MAASCAECHEPLTIAVQPEDEEDAATIPSDSTTEVTTVPDDVCLNACSHHFHWS